MLLLFTIGLDGTTRIETRTSLSWSLEGGGHAQDGRLPDMTCVARRSRINFGDPSALHSAIVLKL